jgi:drug/metabolite transporter (DMT)-like permease
MNWLVFALMTVVSWGVYGIFLHTGQMGMKDVVNGRYKAFLFVGLAYFLTAVLAPLAVLVFRGADWNYPKGGMLWSLVAGITGAIGAFCVLLAFGAKGTPAVVMSIVFAGAPVVNALVAIWQHPPDGGIGSIKPQFFLGILLAALGGCLVTLYKPGAPVAKPQSAAVSQAAAVNPQK